MENNFQKLLFDELIDFFQPIIDNSGNEETIDKFFKETGWDIKQLLNEDQSDLLTVISNIIATLQIIEDLSASPPNSIIELISAINQIAPTINALHDLSSASAISSLPNEPRIKELPEDLSHYLLANYIANKSPVFFRLLQLLGIAGTKEGEPIIVNNTFVHIPDNSIHFYFDSIGKLLTNPQEHFKDLYWPNDFPDIDETNKVANRLFPKIALLLSTLDINSFIGRGIGPEELSPAIEKKLAGLMSIYYNFFARELSGYQNITATVGILPETEGGPGIYMVPSGKLNAEVLLDDWKLLISAGAEIDGFSVSRSGFNIYSANGELRSFDFELALSKIINSDEKALLIGSRDSTRIEIGGITTGSIIQINSSRKEFKIYSQFKDCSIVIAASEGDSFIGKLLGDNEIKASSSIKILWSNLSGFHLEGSGNLEILFPVHIQLGPLEIQGLIVAINPKDADIPITVSSTLRAELGPLIVVVENIGLSSNFSFPSNSHGNLGPVDFNLGFKPPNGLGLSINVGAVIGGGYLFFDFENEEYAGVLELTIAGFISVKAIGLITTKMPDGSKGFSMLLIITAEFFPPFQLSYGFTLNAVGGLLGLNRTVLLDPLRDGVRTGAVNSIMFPQNVIANAPRIISDLKAIFPPYEARFLIGPMAKIGWGTPTLISLSLGLIIEIPGNIAILGVLKLALPEERIPLVQIQVAFVGTIDFDKGMLTFDASLYESFILTMTLEGDMAVRLKWGDSPDFILTVGGFHPSYTPPPLALPSLRRLAINILNTEIAKIRVECYQAVTPSSVQFGAKAELHFDLSACSIEGHIAFDALFQFSPFYFIITLSAGLKLSAIGIDVMTVRVRMSLEGPTPWRAKGSGSVSVLFFDISADFDKTWGEQKNTALPDIEILPQLIADLNKREQWSTGLTTGKNLLVSLRKLEEASEVLLVLHPAGSLVVQQKLLPLSVNIDKVGNQKTSDVKQVRIASASSNGMALTLKPVKENFARAQYQNLSDAEKLSSPAFEKLPGGAEISSGENVYRNGKLVRKNVEYELTIVDKEPAQPQAFLETDLLFANFLKGSSVSKSTLSKSYKDKLKPFDQKLNVLEEGYAVAFQANNKAYDNKSTFASEIMARSYMRDLLREKPTLKKQIHVVPNYELEKI